MRDLASRLKGRVALTIDAYAAYPQTVEEAFSRRVDYGTTDMGIFNSFVERQNLIMHSRMKRYARRTNAHSKTLENHVAVVNLDSQYAT